MTASTKLILIPSLVLTFVPSGLVPVTVAAIASANGDAAHNAPAGASESFDSATAENTDYRWNVDD